MLLRCWCEGLQRINNVLKFLLIQIQNTCHCRIRWVRSFISAKLMTIHEERCEQAQPRVCLFIHIPFEWTIVIHILFIHDPSTK